MTCHELAQPMNSTLGSRHPPCMCQMIDPDAYFYRKPNKAMKGSKKGNEVILIAGSFLSQPVVPVVFLSQSATTHHFLLRFLQFPAMGWCSTWRPPPHGVGGFESTSSLLQIQRLCLVIKSIVVNKYPCCLMPSKVSWSYRPILYHWNMIIFLSCV